MTGLTETLKTKFPNMRNLKIVYFMAIANIIKKPPIKQKH